MSQTIEQLKAELEAARLENATLKAAVVDNLSMKVSEKGAISVYGAGRFPVTLYLGQWQRVIPFMADNLPKFVAGNPTRKLADGTLVHIKTQR